MVYTDFRPTPLQHYIYPAGGDGLFLVEDEKVCVYSIKVGKKTSPGNSGCETAGIES